jgi:hypothetical protein
MTAESRVIHLVVQFDISGDHAPERAFTSLEAAVRFAEQAEGRYVVSILLDALEGEDGS